MSQQPGTAPESRPLSSRMLESMPQLCDFSSLHLRQREFPVLINGARYHDLPPSLAEYQALLVENDSAIDSAASRLAQALTSRVFESRDLSPEAERRAAELAAGIRTPAIDPVKAANSVFLVHGRDRDFRDEVEKHLEALDIQPVVLSKVGGGSRSLAYWPR